MDDQPYAFLALGDSYTIGEAVDVHERWCVQLSKMARESGLILNTPYVVAQSGWATVDLINQLKAVPISGKYDLVTLLIGVNNQYRSLPLHEFEVDLTFLIKTAIVFADNNQKHVLVLSIPDWGVTPYADGLDRNLIAGEIDSYNAVVYRVCDAEDVALLDITPISRKARINPSLIARDGLHFSGLMYEEWARMALPFVLSTFGGS